MPLKSLALLLSFAILPLRGEDGKTIAPALDVSFRKSGLPAAAESVTNYTILGYAVETQLLRSKDPNLTNKNGTMSEEVQQTYLKDFEAKLISPAEAKAWQRSASNAGYNHFGCAKTFALIGQAFAEANHDLLDPGKPK